MEKNLISIPYGTGKTLNLEIPKGRFAGELVPNSVYTKDSNQVLSEALNHPLNSPDVKTFLQGAESVLVIVNDATRPTPTAKMLEPLVPYLKKTKTRVLVATGIHQKLTQAEEKKILGPLHGKFPIVCHDSIKSPVRDLGKSRTGTVLLINDLVFHHEKIIVIGSVEPHYFAGFTGGRKGFLPGVAGQLTISQNHRHAMAPESKLLALEGNPVHQDMVDALSIIKKHCDIFSIQAVLDADHNLFGCSAGHIDESFNQAVALAKRVFCVTCAKAAEVVVAVAPPPMDSNLYQSQKALESGKLALKKGGVIILVSKCAKGIGEGHFSEMLKSGDNPKEVLEKISGQYVLGAHKAASIAHLAMDSSIWVISELSAEKLSPLHMRKMPTIQEAVDQALLEFGPAAKALIVQSASTIVPMLTS